MQYTTASERVDRADLHAGGDAVFGWMTGGEAWSLGKAFGGALAILGAAIAILGDDFGVSLSIGFGDFLMVLATLLAAIYAVFSKPYLARYSPLIVTTIAMASGALTLLIFSSVQNAGTVNEDLHTRRRRLAGDPLYRNHWRRAVVFPLCVGAGAYRADGDQ